MDYFIGREKEIQLLEQVLAEDRPAFVAVYGRRRIGKTLLIRKVFGERLTFHLTGIANVTKEQQLANFQAAFERQAPLSLQRETPENWFSAFQQLITFLETCPPGKKVIFLDELPWLDTPKSDFISSLEHFWNSWASARNDVVLVGCGSAASWMLNKLIHSRGGLHNRVTTRIRLEPFTLREAETLLLRKNAALDRYQIIQFYMAVGGVPFYLDTFDGQLSPMQNIEISCFSKDGFLRTEFDHLFQSLFVRAERHIAIVEAIATKSKGLTREEIIHLSGAPNNGSTTQLLEELEESGFIRKYQPFQKSNRQSLFQLVDFFSLFHLKFIKHANFRESGNWLAALESPTYRAWSGYAFEQVCLAHVPQIKQALGISGIFSQSSSWRSKGAENGAQVDLLIDRRDHVINLCEIKFSGEPFIITKAYAEQLRNKIAVFKSETATRKAVWLAMITTFGLKKNEYSGSLVQHELDMNCLFS
ncbi:MAG: ATP-binding protein [Saprospiraceae bacterium]|nr:ATP-binding protein [Saprospiraceae bacterium]